MNSQQRRWPGSGGWKVVLVAAVLVLAGSGCGVPRGDLSGTVKYQNKPVIYGGVTVIGKDNVPHAGEIKEDGTYKVTGIPAGPVRIAVSSPNPNPPPPPSGVSGEPRGGKADAGHGHGIVLPAPTVRTGWRALPPQYADLEKTPIHTEIEAKPDNTFAIDLK
jgi:hypothetical protein